LTGSAPNYQLRGVVRNHSSKYTLTRVLLGFVVEGVSTETASARRKVTRNSAASCARTSPPDSRHP
jgi:hypothetical protein